MADVRRLAELSMPTELAKEVASQMDAALADKTEIAALTALADPATATTTEIATKVNEVIAALQA